MPSNLICPNCGHYQNNTKLIRQIGVGLKNTAKVVGHVAVKQGAKAIASTVVDNDLALRAVSTSAGNAAKSMGLGMSNTQSLSSVQYKCSKCGCYWDGYDSPSAFNDLQKQIVKSMLKKKKDNEIKNKPVIIRFFIITLLLILLSVYMWFAKYSYETQESFLSIEYTSTHYSWHYYFFFLFSWAASCTLFYSIYKYNKYNRIMNLKESIYARRILEDSNNV